MGPFWICLPAKGTHTLLKNGREDRFVVFVLHCWHVVIAIVNVFLFLFAVFMKVLVATAIGTLISSFIILIENTFVVVFLHKIVSHFLFLVFAWTQFGIFSFSFFFCQLTSSYHFCLFLLMIVKCLAVPFDSRDLSILPFLVCNFRIQVFLIFFRVICERHVFIIAV